ncbi:MULTISPECIES: type II toxin-antitoxin system VapC family toxin [Cyanophyceae]|uniref:type II toxin-antitoxin system VapC family toxin n=1 Tax=Cyanophyceae TaxID=3028117 RepID=UPI00016DCCA7|nr:MULTISPECIES: type II toxin-antitoxin system VapC family toxin [Cyanophyceae]ACA99764.1 PIN domain protein [Picosynechococcus sp. PCC 7002]SMH55995.1 PIN domain nuclease, a component of toxin-antitoxin system (PIN domain) [Picosynechococcus sp. OG1]SMQ83361.1 PIN domain nuclease, a component of toxin-antitoxin system (PIN domain) [Synechococcus sp. 7002]
MIILDTHVWIWWMTESPKLSSPAAAAIAEYSIIGIPSISCWEIAMLVAKNRLTFSMDVQTWLKLSLEHPKIRLLPLSPEIAVLSTRLPKNFHSDPADRLIVATCLTYQTSLVSKDSLSQQWGQLEVIW